jgi:hypothetical protein
VILSSLHSSPSDIKPNVLFILLIISSLTDGIAQGILLLQEKIAQNQLGASEFEITLIGVIASTTIIFSLLFTVIYSGNSKKWLLAGAYMAGRFIFLFSFYISNSTIFLVFLFSFGVCNSV